MKPKILIAISDQFLRSIYEDFFRESGFLVLVSEDNVLSIVLKERPNIILLDIVYAEKDDFNILKSLKESDATKKIPVILFSRFADEESRQKAFTFEVKDFFIGEYNSPWTVFSKVKTHLEGEKSYRLPITNLIMEEIAKDLGYQSLKCNKCFTQMEMILLKDSNKGKNYFKVSFVCPKCGI
ncbi:MAG: response regulator [Candidatus Pacebacteria bacterium]|nr:response regulator [Candidatus Paceibacterota bacterium]